MDFGHATIELDGEQTEVAFFVMTLPFSDAFFVCAFLRECTETFQEGHKRAFGFFGGVAIRISYDNSKIAVITIGRGRNRTSHMLASGADLAYVSNQLGHANPSITLRIYSHWVPGTRRVMTSILDSEQACAIETNSHLL